MVIVDMQPAAIGNATDIIAISANSTAHGHRKALVCVPAKTGSSSFYKWLFGSLAGRTWNFTGPPWIQEIKSERWKGLRESPYTLRSLHQLAPSAQHGWLTDPGVKRFAMHRSPIERAISGYHSKVSCVPCREAHEHVGRINKLMRDAPRAASRVDRTRTCASPSNNGKKPTASDPVPCLGIDDWTDLLLEAVAAGRMLDPHFSPQTVQCAHDKIYYDTLIPITANSEGLAALATQLGLPVVALGHDHKISRNGASALIRNSTLARLRRLYAADQRILGYPRVMQIATFPGNI